MVRAGGRVAHSMPFVALRSGTGGVIASASDSVDLARLMIAWTKLDRDAALVSTFATHEAASAWLTASSPPLPHWATRTCVAADDQDVIVLDDETDASPVFALLRQAGGQLAAEANASLIPRLVNTIKALNGEVALVRMLPSMGEAEKWLLSPRVPMWLLRPAAPASTCWASEDDKVDVVAVTAADGVIELSDDEDVGLDAEDVARTAFRRAAQALPPPPPLKRTILSLSSIQDSMLLPVVYQRNPGTGAVVRTDNAAPSRRHAGPSSAIGASLHHPSSSLPSPSSMASGTPRERDSRTPRRGLFSFSGPARSSARDMSPPQSSLASADGASGSRAFALSQRLTPRGGRESGSSMRAQACGDAISQLPSSTHQTCTPVPARVTLVDEPSPKKLRTAEAMPFHLGRLAKSIVQRKTGLFVTGGGGVGKTRVLRQCAHEHREAHGGSRGGLHVVAPTGVAAAAAGGVTVHSYLRLPAGCFDESLSEEEDAVRLYNGMDGMTKRRLASTSLLLLDEVSMVSSRMFTVLVYSIDMAHVKLNDDLEWRIVAFGDFFQLPPVRGDEDQYDTSGSYAFKSVYWTRLFHNNQLELRYVWRQEDKKLIKMLSSLRFGHVSVDLAQFLQSRSAAYKARKETGVMTDIRVTRIFPHRHRVKAHNLECLSAMEKANGCARVVYDAADYPIGVNMTEEQVRKQLDAAIMAPKKLEVCVGARVAACATISDGEVEVPNGTVGTVVAFKSITAHGASGQTSSAPIVRFSTVRGPVLATVKRVDMKLQSVARDGAYASRYQIPLVLAWAVTVHRCQGLSMDAAVLDLASCFVDGMVYVALSRVRFMNGVHILSFSPSRVRADRRVALFYENQRSVEDEFASCLDTGRC